MKGSGLATGLLCAVLYLLGTPSTGLKTLHLGSCVITTNLQAIQTGFSEIRDSVVCKGGIYTPLLDACLFPSWLSLFPQTALAVYRLRTPSQDYAFQELAVSYHLKTFGRGCGLRGRVPIYQAKVLRSNSSVTKKNFFCGKEFLPLGPGRSCLSVLSCLSFCLAS
jgi:hypothetical protein